MKKKRNAGFTLVEMLLYMGLMTIFFGVLTDIFITTLDVKKESEAVSAVEADGRFILSRMMYDSGQTGALSLPATYALVGNNLTLNGIPLNSSETKITDLTFRQLGNAGGKPSVQVTFTVTSLTQRSGGLFEVRNYQTTVGTR